MANVICKPDERVSLRSGVHKHLCDRCGTCWKHNTKEGQASTTAFYEAHSCPRCGDKQTFKHRTPEEEAEADAIARNASIASGEDLSEIFRMLTGIRGY